MKPNFEVELLPEAFAFIQNTEKDISKYKQSQTIP